MFIDFRADGIFGARRIFVELKHGAQQLVGRAIHRSRQNQQGSNPGRTLTSVERTRKIKRALTSVCGQIEFCRKLVDLQMGTCPFSLDSSLLILRAQAFLSYPKH